MDDDDLLAEILLRLPPKPSSLPRASAVCTRWRGIVNDPGFLRRFRLCHRRSAPTVGFFRANYERPGVSFVPALEAPDRIPDERFSLQLGLIDTFMLFNCRHGLLLLMLVTTRAICKLLVWEPVTGEQHHLIVPGEFVGWINGAVLRPSESVHHFQVILVSMDGNRAVASVYSSETGLWGDLVSTLFPDEVRDETYFESVPALLCGGSIYWIVSRGSKRVLGFDLHRNMLTVTPLPVDVNKEYRCQYMFLRAEGGRLGFLSHGGGLGFLFKSACNLQLWKRVTDCDGIASWALERIIEVDTLLPLDPEGAKSSVVLGYAECSNAVFLSTDIGRYSVQLESLKFEKMIETQIWSLPFECVYTGGNCLSLHCGYNKT
jgi:hypothetical protein